MSLRHIVYYALSNKAERRPSCADLFTHQVFNDHHTIQLVNSHIRLLLQGHIVLRGKFRNGLSLRQLEQLHSKFHSTAFIRVVFPEVLFIVLRLQCTLSAILWCTCARNLHSCACWFLARMRQHVVSFDGVDSCYPYGIAVLQCCFHTFLLLVLIGCIVAFAR